MKIEQNPFPIPIREHGTSAPGFHLSDTLDWSSLATRIKNQVIVLPASKQWQGQPETRKYKLIGVLGPHSAMRRSSDSDTALAIQN